MPPAAAQQALNQDIAAKIASARAVANSSLAAVSSPTQQPSALAPAAQQSQQPPPPVPVLRQGWLLKRTTAVGGKLVDWKRRFFVLDALGQLYYFSQKVRPGCKHFRPARAGTGHCDV